MKPEFLQKSGNKNESSSARQTPAKSTARCGRRPDEAGRRVVAARPVVLPHVAALRKSASQGNQERALNRRNDSWNQGENHAKHKKHHLQKNNFRDEFEINDSDNKCRGFIWSCKGFWCIQIDDAETSYKDTLKEAKEHAVNQINDSCLRDEHSSCLWDGHGKSGMRHMEKCDVSGGQTDCNPIKTIKL